jgi:hypothetical protein
MGAPEERPGQTEEKRERPAEHKSKKEAPHLGHTQGNQDGQASPRWRLKAVRVWEGAGDGKGFHRFFSVRAKVE